MDLFDVRSAAVVRHAEIADRPGTERWQRGDPLQCLRSGDIGITDLKDPVGVARQGGRNPDKARQPYRSKPPGCNEVYVSHVEFSFFGVGIRRWSSGELPSCAWAAESGSRTY